MLPNVPNDIKKSTDLFAHWAAYTFRFNKVTDDDFTKFLEGQNMCIFFLNFVTIVTTSYLWSIMKPVCYFYDKFLVTLSVFLSDNVTLTHNAIQNLPAMKQLTDNVSIPHFVMRYRSFWIQHSTTHTDTPIYIIIIPDKAKNYITVCVLHQHLSEMFWSSYLHYMFHILFNNPEITQIGSYNVYSFSTVLPGTFS